MEEFLKSLLGFYVDLSSTRHLPRVNIKKNIDYSKAWIQLYRDQIMKRDISCFEQGTSVFKGVDLLEIVKKSSTADQECIWNHLIAICHYEPMFLEDPEEDGDMFNPEEIDKVCDEFAAISNINAPWMKGAIKDTVTTLFGGKSFSNPMDLFNVLSDKDKMKDAFDNMKSEIEKAGIDPEQMKRDIAQSKLGNFTDDDALVKLKEAGLDLTNIDLQDAFNKMKNNGKELAAELNQ